jgi:hypothetical protein
LLSARKLLGLSVNKNPYYFSKLPNDQKEVYRTLLSGIETITDRIELPLKPINEISKIFNYLLLDNPILFYVTSFSQTDDLYRNKSTFIPNYTYSRRAIQGYTDAIVNGLRVFDGAKAMNDFDKEKYVHDFCLKHYKYDYTFNNDSYSILGLHLNKSAVCEGIAKFVKLALNYLGVKCLVVTGDASNPSNNSATEGHAWNIVVINGKTYHLDVTFDMTLTSRENRYDYFNLSDEDIKKDHIMLDDVPVCETKGGDYFSLNSLLAHNRSELEKQIKACLKNGKRDVMIKLMNVDNPQTIIDKVLSIAQQQYGKIYMGSVTVEVNYNLSQLVLEIKFK